MMRFLHITLFILVIVSTTLGTSVFVAHAADTQSSATSVSKNTSAKALASSGDIPSAVKAKQGLGPDKITDYKQSANSGFSWIMIKIMSLFAWLVGVAALALDYSVYYTVVQAGNYVHNLTAIGVTWRILRDLGNIMLIFGFLAAGLATILNVDIYGWSKKMLPMLLIAAVFINFSLFFSEAVIDVGNLFATQFYTQINGGHLPSANPAGIIVTSPSDGTKAVTLKPSNEGISNKLMGVLGLQTLYGAARTNSDVLAKDSPWYVGFMGIILFMVTAFVMFSLAFILVGRFVALIFLMILSPIGFAGLAVPGLAKRAKQWWTLLIEQTIVAPIMLLMLYIALAVITDAQFLVGFGMNNPDSATGFVNNANLPGFASYTLSFMVAMGLLIAVIIQAKRWSAVGSGLVEKAGRSITSRATKLGMGTLRWHGRLGAGAARFGAQHTGGRLAYNMAQKIKTSEFGQTQSGRIIATAFGKGGKGFKERVEKTDKKHKDYVKSVGEAIEEKNLPTIIAAQKKRSEAEQFHTSATDEHKKAQEAEKPLIDEVKRLEKVISDNRNDGKNFTPEQKVAKDSLKQTQEKLSKAEETTKSEDKYLKTTKSDLATALNKEKVATDAISAAKKKATLGYAKNAQAPVDPLSPISLARFAVSGTRSNMALNKIIKDTLNKMTDTQKAVSVLKKSWEEGAKKEAKVSGESVKASEKLNDAKEDLADKTEEEAGSH